MHAAKTMTVALVTVARIHPLPSFSSECNGQAETQVQTTATGGAALTGERPSAVSGAFSIPGGAPVYTSMSALPDRDRSGQARVDEPALVARALAGDRAALGMLVEAYAGSVRRITRAPTGTDLARQGWTSPRSSRARSREIGR